MHEGKHGILDGVDDMDDIFGTKEEHKDDSKSNADHDHDHNYEKKDAKKGQEPHSHGCGCNRA